jgi:hypothetical protein
MAVANILLCYDTATITAVKNIVQALLSTFEKLKALEKL